MCSTTSSRQRFGTRTRVDSSRPPAAEGRPVAEKGTDLLLEEPASEAETYSVSHRKSFLKQVLPLHSRRSLSSIYIELIFSTGRSGLWLCRRCGRAMPFRLPMVVLSRPRPRLHRRGNLRSVRHGESRPGPGRRQDQRLARALGRREGERRSPCSTTLGGAIALLIGIGKNPPARRDDQQLPVVTRHRDDFRDTPSARILLDSLQRAA